MPSVFDEEDSTNPCRFKGVCQSCNKVDVDERPMGCGAIECDYYTPCQDCGNNKELVIGEGVCRNCHNTRTKKALNEKKRNGPLRSLDDVMENGPAASASVKNGESNFIVPALGQPPVGLNPSEREYYEYRWEQFDGFYRDPSAYSIVHSMILEELNLRRLEQDIINARGQLNKDITEEKGVCLKYLNMLKKQLPDREALRGSDAETTLSMIYDKYKKEQGKGATQNGRVTRLFSLEAVALAPQLPHRLNLVSILKRCGFEIEKIDEAIAKYHTELGDTPDEILESMGFRLKEKYARPFESYEERDDDTSFQATNAVSDESDAEVPVDASHSESAQSGVAE